MTPPISIDGTDITGATIDGTDVQEITVDGQTVFTAETLPVAYSNLIAWYPFDSSFYGGSNADDVTALFNPGQSGDSTAFDATVDGATFQSSGGVTDINAGANSGGFDFDGTNDYIDTNITSFANRDAITVSAWVNASSGALSGNRAIIAKYDSVSNQREFQLIYDNGDDEMQFYVMESPGNFDSDNIATIASISTGSWFHIAGVFEGDTRISIYKDGSKGTDSTSTPTDFGNTSERTYIGSVRNASTSYWDGSIDDVRIYETALSDQQISDIYDATKPASKP